MGAMWPLVVISTFSSVFASADSIPVNLKKAWPAPPEGMTDMIETVLFFLLLVIMLYAGHQLWLGKDTETPPAAEDVFKQNGAADKKKGLSAHLRTLKLGIEPLVFILAISMMALVVFLLFLELFPGSTVMALVASIALVLFAISLVGDLARWRARKFETGLVDSIDLLQAALQSGATPMESIRTAAEASKGNLKTEFEELYKRLELGMPIEKATARMVEMYNSEGVRLFTQVLIAKWNAGGDLLLLLRSVNRIIRDRLKLRLRISGQLAGARHALIFVAIIPYLVIPAFLWKEPAWLDTLTGHHLGPTFLLVAVLLQVVGLFWMRRILRTDQ